MSIRANVIEAIGNTPLIKLKRASEMTGCTILGKAEFMNPGQSVKDRAALFIIRDAEARGALKPGGMIVEGTAGNTGIGLALVGNALGLPHRHRHPRHAEPGEEGHAPACRRRADRGARGALRQPEQLREGTPAASPRSWPRASRTARSGPTSSTTSPTARRISRRTGPEIWEQTGGKVDGFICAVGTGGTLAGVAMALKERNKDIEIGLADPMGAALYSYYTTAS